MGLTVIMPRASNKSGRESEKRRRTLHGDLEGLVDLLKAKGKLAQDEGKVMLHHLPRSNLPRDQARRR